MDQMHQHRDGIETSLKDTQVHLDKLYNEITRTLEKIGSREKYLNNQLEHHLQEFRYDKLVNLALGSKINLLKYCSV